MELNEEGLMQRPEPRGVNLEKTMGAVPIAKTPTVKQKISYRPISRLGNGKLAAYDVEIGGDVIFGSTEAAMVQREFEYARTHPDDYEAHFPRAAQVNAKIERTLDAVSEGENHVRDTNNIDEIIKGREGLAATAVSMTETVEGNVEVAKGRYCHNKRCSASANRRAFPTEARFCGVCGGENLGEAMPLVSAGDYLKKIDAPFRTDTIGGIIADDIGEFIGKTFRGIGRAVKSTGRMAFKTVAYPLVGNLSAELQNRLEKAVGRENFDALSASRTSIISNTILGGISGYVLSNSIKVNSSIVESISLGIACGAISCLGDFFPRCFKAGSDIDSLLLTSRPIASLPGKLISYPIEWILKGYDGIRAYAHSVKERAKNGRSEYKNAEI